MLANPLTFDPFGIPFIPFGSLKSKDLILSKKCKIYNIEAKNYGHCDILDYPYSNYMHRSRMAVGNSNRSHVNLNNYHKWAANLIKTKIKI